VLAAVLLDSVSIAGNDDLTLNLLKSLKGISLALFNALFKWQESHFLAIFRRFIANRTIRRTRHE